MLELEKKLPEKLSKWEFHCLTQWRAKRDGVRMTSLEMQHAWKMHRVHLGLRKPYHGGPVSMAQAALFNRFSREQLLRDAEIEEEITRMGRT